MARLSSPEGELLAIDQEADSRTWQPGTAASREVVDYLPGRSMLVVAWIEAAPTTPLTSAALQPPSHRWGYRTLLRGSQFVNDFDMFVIQRRYLGLVQDRGFRLRTATWSSCPQVDRIATALALRQVPSVPCNDLLTNFIDGGEALVDRLRVLGHGDPGLRAPGTCGASPTCRSSSSRSSSPTTAARDQGGGTGEAASASCRSTAGRYGRRSRTGSATSTSTSGMGDAGVRPGDGGVRRAGRKRSSIRRRRCPEDP